MNSSMTLEKTSLFNKRKDKTKVTIMYIVNANRTEKLILLVINNSNMPCAFQNTSINSHNELPVNYDYNENAWMRHDIFQYFLNFFLSSLK